MGVTTVSPNTMGGDWTEYSSAFNQSRSPRVARGMSSIRSSRPPSPKSAHGRPVPASTQTRYPLPVPKNTRSSVRSGPFDQYATPRWFQRALIVVVPSS